MNRESLEQIKAYHRQHSGEWMDDSFWDAKELVKEVEQAWAREAEKQKRIDVLEKAFEMMNSAYKIPDKAFKEEVGDEQSQA